MKLLIDGQTLSTAERDRGIGVAFRRICEQLLVNDEHTDWFMAVRSTSDLAILGSQFRHRVQPVELPATRETASFDERTRRYSDVLNETVAQLGIDAYWNPNPFMLNTILPTQLTGVAVFATVYDVIPAVMHALYLDVWPEVLQREYRRRLAALPHWARRLIFASASTQRDFAAIDARAAEQGRVVPLGVDHARFWPRAAPPDSTREPYLLFTAGFDPRKNMDKALEAFARLVQRHPAEFRRLQFCVVCAAPPREAAAYRRLAQQLGVAERLTLTGFVSDQSLGELYRSASAFFFPSRYEGFGLPVLEALACGIPVVAAATSSLTEVAGSFATFCSETNVDDMAEALARVLRKGAGDPERRRLAVDHARQFTWSKTAALYSQVFRERPPVRAATVPHRPRIAYVSPWPPQRSGIAAYSRALLPHLARHLDLTVFVDDCRARAPNPDDVAIRDLACLPDTAAEYDAVVYHIGNSTTYHRKIYEAAWHHRGVVVLHEVNIHPFLADAFLRSSEEHLYEAALTEGYGADGAEHYRWVRATGVFDIWRFPMSHALARRSRATIVHNRWARQQLAGIDNVFVVPPGAWPAGPAAGVSSMGRSPLGRCGVLSPGYPVDPGPRAYLHDRLHLPSGRFIISALGYVQRLKRIPQLLAALKELVQRGYPVHLVLGGELIDPSMDLRSLVAEATVSAHVTVTGYLEADDFAALLRGSDVVVNLRYPSMGEVSAVLLQAFAAGKACVVTNHGPSAEYPDAVCWKVDPGDREVPLLVAYLEELMRNPEARGQLGRNAAFFAEHYASLQRAAELYADVLAQLCTQG